MTMGEINSSLIHVCAVVNITPNRPTNDMLKLLSFFFLFLFLVDKTSSMMSFHWIKTSTTCSRSAHFLLFRGSSSRNTVTRIVAFSSSSSRKSSVQANEQEKGEEEQTIMKSYKLQGRTTKNDDNDTTSTKNSSKRRSRSRPSCGVTVSTNTGHVLQTDLPKRMGGQDTAPQPVEILLASWMGCTQATALFVGRHLNLVIDLIEFDNIIAYRDERGALELPIDQTPSVVSRLQRITGTITVHTQCSPQQDKQRGNDNNNNNNGISKEQLLTLKEQTELRCPVANMMIASGCIMDVEWIDASTRKDMK